MCRPQDVVIFIVGGTTYEESRAVALYNSTNSGIRFILGGTTLLNSKRYASCHHYIILEMRLRSTVQVYIVSGISLLPHIGGVGKRCRRRRFTFVQPQHWFVISYEGRKILWETLLMWYFSHLTKRFDDSPIRMNLKLCFTFHKTYLHLLS